MAISPTEVVRQAGCIFLQDHTQSAAFVAAAAFGMACRWPPSLTLAVSLRAAALATDQLPTLDQILTAASVRHHQSS
jgi:hypothetical protein